MVSADTPGMVLIAAVVRVPKMEFTLGCGDPFKLMERLPRIRDMVHAHVDANVLDAHIAKVTFRPVDGMLVVGVTPVRGVRLQMTTEAAREALAHDLKFAQRQSYAFKSPVPTIVAPNDQSLVSSTDSGSEVVGKYQRAIGQIANPTSAPSTGPSSGSGSWRTPNPQKP